MFKLLNFNNEECHRIETPCQYLVYLIEQKLGSWFLKAGAQ